MRLITTLLLLVALLGMTNALRSHLSTYDDGDYDNEYDDGEALAQEADDYEDDGEALAQDVLVEIESLLAGEAECMSCSRSYAPQSAANYRCRRLGKRPVRRCGSTRYCC